MLRAVLADLKAWGKVRTIATVDIRLMGADLAADRLVPLSPAQHMRTLEALAQECSAALLIAPESDGALGRITQRMESLDVPLLGANSDAVSIAADKWQCYQLFRENAIPTPETRLLNGDHVSDTLSGLNPPWVVKPRDGAGAEGVGLAADYWHLYVKKRSLVSPVWASAWCRPTCLAYTPVSPCLPTGRMHWPSASTEQKMEIGSSFIYRGGRIPLQHPLTGRAFSLARQAVSLIPGLRGYVGVDLVMTTDECYVLEINPRLTTSYVGLRQVINLNLAEAIWNCCVWGLLPHTTRITGSISFRKDGSLG